MDPKNYNVINGFNTIAPAYDLVNDVMTFGLHRLWRKKLCRNALKDIPQRGQILDIATGTGDVALELLKRRPDISIWGIDPAERMLQIAEDKKKQLSQSLSSHLHFEVSDGRKLPFQENQFDGVTVSWGIRNIKPRAEAFAEIMRVLKPGGTLWILESGQPQARLVGALYRAYAKVLPSIGGSFSKFKPAYQYYTSSVNEMPSGAEFVAEIQECGFVDVNFEALCGGVVYIYSGKKGRPKNSYSKT